MAVDYGLLSANQPQVQPYSAGASILGGMQTGQDMAFKEQQTKNAKLTNSLQQMSAVNNLAGSVAFAPPEMKEQAYNYALRQAKAAGLDVSSLPPTWGPDADAAVQSAYFNSGSALERMKAQVQMDQAQALMGKNVSEANKNNFDMGRPPMFGGAGNNTSSILNGGQPAVGQQPVNGQPGANPTGNIAPGQPGYVQQVANQTPPIQPTTIPGMAPKAQLEQQTALGQAQGKDWVNFKSEMAQGEQGYIGNKQTLDQIQPYIDKESDLANPYPAVTGGLYGTGKTGQQLNVLGKALNLEYTAQFAKTGGITRLDIPIVKSIQFLAPGTDKYKESNQIEKNRIQLANEWGHGLSQLLPSLEQNGITDKDQALQTYNQALLKSGAIDPKTGKIDFGKFEMWPKYLPKNLQQSYYQAHPEMVRPDLTDKFSLVNPDTGNPITATYENVLEAASKHNMSPEVYMKSLNMQPITPPQQPTQQQVATQQSQNVPRGIRNNNPGNIIKTSSAWNGEVQGNDSRFKTFATPQAGINAMSGLLDRYYRNGKTTVSDIISKWAPSSENNTLAYIKDVAKNMGVSATEKLNLADANVKAALMKAIMQHENGRVPYDDNLIMGSL